MVLQGGVATATSYADGSFERYSICSALVQLGNIDSNFQCGGWHPTSFIRFSMIFWSKFFQSSSHGSSILLRRDITSIFRTLYIILYFGTNWQVLAPFQLLSNLLYFMLFHQPRSDPGRQPWLQLKHLRHGGARLAFGRTSPGWLNLFFICFILFLLLLLFLLQNHYNSNPR